MLTTQKLLRTHVLSVKNKSDNRTKEAKYVGRLANIPYIIYRYIGSFHFIGKLLSAG